MVALDGTSCASADLPGTETRALNREMRMERTMDQGESVSSYKLGMWKKTGEGGQRKSENSVNFDAETTKVGYFSGPEQCDVIQMCYYCNRKSIFIPTASTRGEPDENVNKLVSHVIFSLALAIAGLKQHSSSSALALLTSRLQLHHNGGLHN